MTKNSTVWKGLAIFAFCTFFLNGYASDLTINFSDMTPHNGQEVFLRIYDKANGSEIDRTEVTASPAFSLDFNNLEVGHSYWIDFFADFNGNGKYDVPPVDHAWRLSLDDATDHDTIDFVHNTNFTDIMWPYVLTMDFKDMTPHVGQLLELRVVNKADGTEVARQKLNAVPGPDFTMTIPGIMPGNSYRVDFFADLNGNKVYDTPPADHAWRLELDNVTGDTTLTFTHNTNFTDIMWPYVLTMDFKDMTPHVGQMFNLKLYRMNGSDVDSLLANITIDTIRQASFTMTIPGIQPNDSYRVDFYADLNMNGRYDPPPADHAWRLEFDDVGGDTTLLFVHNTNFTDIGGGSSGVPGLESGHGLHVYPNPSAGLVMIGTNDGLVMTRIRLYSISGQILDERQVSTNELMLDYSNFRKGVYFLRIETSGGLQTRKLILR